MEKNEKRQSDDQEENSRDANASPFVESESELIISGSATQELISQKLSSLLSVRWKNAWHIGDLLAYARGRSNDLYEELLENFKTKVTPDSLRRYEKCARFYNDEQTRHPDVSFSHHRLAASKFDDPAEANWVLCEYGVEMSLEEFRLHLNAEHPSSAPPPPSSWHKTANKGSEYWETMTPEQIEKYRQKSEQYRMFIEFLDSNPDNAE